MKIAFVTPASPLHKSSVYRFGHLVYEPANTISGPVILGTILAGAGHSVDIYEELYRDLPIGRILQADVIGLSVMTSTAPRSYELADFFRSRGKRVIMGGFHASALPQEAIEHCDQIIIGEAEDSITATIEGTLSQPVIRGIPVADLDTIPFPDYSLCRTPVKIANFITSRGCTNSCSFCTTSRQFHPYRQMSPERVVEAIRWYRERGFKRVNLQDDNFTADRKRAKRICRLLIDAGLSFRETFFFGRIDVADDDELLQLLDEAGLRIVLVGMESTNQKSLDAINKRQTTEMVLRNARHLAENNMKLSASIILGLDDDRKEEIDRTVDFCSNIDAYSFQPPILTPFPGTPLYDRLRAEGRILTDAWQYYDMMHVVFRPKHLSPRELQKLFERSLIRFYNLRSIPRVLARWGFREAIKRLGMAMSLRISALVAPAVEPHYHTLLAAEEHVRAVRKKTGGSLVKPMGVYP